MSASPQIPLLLSTILWSSLAFFCGQLYQRLHDIASKLDEVLEVEQPEDGSEQAIEEMWSWNGFYQTLREFLDIKFKALGLRLIFLAQQLDDERDNSFEIGASSFSDTDPTPDKALTNSDDTLSEQSSLRRSKFPKIVRTGLQSLELEKSKRNAAAATSNSNSGAESDPSYRSFPKIVRTGILILEVAKASEDAPNEAIEAERSQAVVGLNGDNSSTETLPDLSGVENLHASPSQDLQAERRFEDRLAAMTRDHRAEIDAIFLMHRKELENQRKMLEETYEQQSEEREQQHEVRMQIQMENRFNPILHTLRDEAILAHNTGLEALKTLESVKMWLSDLRSFAYDAFAAYRSLESHLLVLDPSSTAAIRGIRRKLDPRTVRLLGLDHAGNVINQNPEWWHDKTLHVARCEAGVREMVVRLGKICETEVQKEDFAQRSNKHPRVEEVFSDGVDESIDSLVNEARQAVDGSTAGLGGETLPETGDNKYTQETNTGPAEPGVQKRTAEPSAEDLPDYEDTFNDDDPQNSAEIISRHEDSQTVDPQDITHEDPSAGHASANTEEEGLDLPQHTASEIPYAPYGLPSFAESLQPQSPNSTPPAASPCNNTTEDTPGRHASLFTDPTQSELEDPSSAPVPPGPFFAFEMPDSSPEHPHFDFGAIGTPTPQNEGFQFGETFTAPAPGPEVVEAMGSRPPPRPNRRGGGNRRARR